MKRRWLAWTASCCGVLLALGVHAFVVFGLHDIAPAESPDILHFVRGYVSNDGSENWEPVALPDDWIDTRANTAETWYRFPFQLSAKPSELSAVYLPVLAQNAKVFVNGKSVGDGGRFESPIAHNWPHPLMFPVPPALLNEGNNEITLYIASEPRGTGLLAPFYFGPRDTLLPDYEFRYALKATAPMAFVVVLVILAVLLAWITARSPRDTVYLWFAAILVALACFALPVIVVDIPVSTRAWDWFRITSIAWAVFFITGFTHRFIGVHRPAIERLGFAIFLSGSIIVALVPSDAYYQYAGTYWVALCIGWGTYPCSLLSRRVLGRRYLEGLAVLYSGISLLFFGGHDALMIAGVASRLDGYLIHYASPVVALIFTWVLLSQFVDARRAAERLNVELEDRVQQKARELEEYFRQLQDAERERAVMKERERLMRDMHDGVGGHLASALSLVERDDIDGAQVAETLRQATDDLRLIIHSFEPTGEALSEVLGLLRPRIQRQLDAAGIELHWQVFSTAEVENLGPDMALQIMRIVQEAVTNAIRHSETNALTIFCGDQGSEVVVAITDYGKGMHNGGGQGFGLDNMQTRARQINAHFEVTTSNTGTTLSLKLPVATRSMEQRQTSTNH